MCTMSVERAVSRANSLSPCVPARFKSSKSLSKKSARRAKEAEQKEAEQKEAHDEYGMLTTSVSLPHLPLPTEHPTRFIAWTNNKDD
jgi:hypothetical protein